LEQQHLFFGLRELEDGTSLVDAGVQDGSMLAVNVSIPAATTASSRPSTKIPVTASTTSSTTRIAQVIVITSEGRNIVINIEPSDTSDDVKGKVQEKAGIPVGKQQLFFEGKELEEGTDLIEAGVKDGSVLRLIAITTTSTTTVRPGASTLAPTTTVAGSSPTTTASLIMQIIVITSGGQSLSIDIDPSDTNDDVKARIQEKAGLLVDQQQLFFDGKELTGGAGLTEAGVKDGSILRLVTSTTKVSATTTSMPAPSTTTLSTMTEGVAIFVVTPVGEKIIIPVSLSDTVQDVKLKVQEKTGIPP
jgi:ubiquitin C